MKILTRYVVREHIGPLVFALTALTSLLMLQYVARQLGNLVGKGLSWSVITEFFVLSLPFTIALTMPMAVLVATLYAFGRMAAENEITAFKASGIRVGALMRPVMFGAALVSLGMIWFNDQVLPAANHRLRLLQQDMARAKPTLALTEQVLNAVQPDFIIRVSRLDNATSRLWDIVIYDLSHGQERKTIYADSGYMTLAPNKEDLQLFLYDGYSQEFPKGEPRRLQRTFFKSQVVRVKGIASTFKETGSDGWKGDREKSICEMQHDYIMAAREFSRLRDDYLRYSFMLVKKGEAVTAPRARPASEPLARIYCNALALIFRLPTAVPPPFPSNAKPPRPITTSRTDVKPTVPVGAIDSAARLAAALAASQVSSAQVVAAVPSAQVSPVSGAPVVPPAPGAPAAPGIGTPATGQPGTVRQIGLDSVTRVGVPTATPSTTPASAQQTAVTSKAESLLTAVVPGTPPSVPPTVAGTQNAAAPASAATGTVQSIAPNAAQSVPPQRLPGQPTPQTVTSAPRITPPPGITLTPDPEVAHRDSLMEARQGRQSAKMQIDEQRYTIDNLAVEIQKKFALSAACFVFVLFGPPIALRFPRGGVGATLGVSIFAFGLYYVCLMAGETLADNGQVPAWLAMWAGNIIFTLFGVLLVLRIEKTADASRSGGIRDWLADRRARRALHKATTLSRAPSPAEAVRA